GVSHGSSCLYVNEHVSIGCENNKSLVCPPPEPSTLIVILLGLIQTTIPPARIVLNVILYFASAPSTSLFMVGILGVLRPGYFCWRVRCRKPQPNVRACWRNPTLDRG